MERIEMDVDGLKISVLKSKQTPVFYIHCSGCDATLWRSQLEVVGGYAIDLPNHGRSSEAEIHTIDDYAYFAYRVIKKLLKRAIVAGHSLGGAVAQRIYLEYRRVVKALILVGTGARLRVLPSILNGLRDNPDETIETIAKMSCVNEDVIKICKEMFSNRTRVMLRDLLLCDKFDLLEKYKSGEIKIDVPTLIIVGEDDRLTPVKYSKFFNQYIPNSKLVIVPDSGHMVMLEKPNEVNRSILEFVKSID
ncbi:carboxylesterase [Archaeoglobales archaeon ex4484_92]|nr:MAG: carboxylesterase [Archaeoglobales archaeon ex4484_92]